MKTISSGLNSHFGGDLTTLAICLRLTRQDGVVIVATNHDTDLTITIPSGSPTLVDKYLSRIGGTDTDVQTSNALNVDNMDQHGALSVESINEDDLHAGLFDYATFKLFAVNYANLSQGIYSLRDGTIGVVTVDRGTFVAQLQGMMEALKLTLGELVNPLCPYNFGDFPFPANYRGRCRKDLTGGTGSPPTSLTVTGILDSVSTDQSTVFDSARTEPGPIGGVNITGITTADPGVVTTATPIGLPTMSTVTIAGVIGMTNVNTVLVIRNPSGNTFEIDDTSGFPSYVSGGVVTPLGGVSGYFDYGLFTVTSGPNTGRSIEVKAYIPGQWTLQAPFFIPLVGTESYSMIAGCNKSPGACKSYDNFDNFGGFPFVPGQDKIIQVAQPQSQQSSGKK